MLYSIITVLKLMQTMVNLTKNLSVLIQTIKFLFVIKNNEINNEF